MGKGGGTRHIYVENELDKSKFTLAFSQGFSRFFALKLVSLPY